MKRTLRVLSILFCLLLLTAITVWFPYRTQGVPEWKLQVLDTHGNPAIGAQINEEWIDPIDEGVSRVDSPIADGNGSAVFPNRIVHNRLAFGFVREKPSARILVCWQNEYGAFYWDGASSELPKELRLTEGRCPYG